MDGSERAASSDMGRGRGRLGSDISHFPSGSASSIREVYGRARVASDCVKAPDSPCYTPREVEGAKPNRRASAPPPLDSVRSKRRRRKSTLLDTCKIVPKYFGKFEFKVVLDGSQKSNPPQPSFADTASAKSPSSSSSSSSSFSDFTTKPMSPSPYSSKFNSSTGGGGNIPPPPPPYLFALGKISSAPLPLNSLPPHPRLKQYNFLHESGGDMDDVKMSEELETSKGGLPDSPSSSSSSSCSFSSSSSSSSSSSAAPSPLPDSMDASFHLEPFRVESLCHLPYFSIKQLDGKTKKFVFLPHLKECLESSISSNYEIEGNSFLRESVAACVKTLCNDVKNLSVNTCLWKKANSTVTAIVGLKSENSHYYIVNDDFWKDCGKYYRSQRHKTTTRMAMIPLDSVKLRLQQTEHVVTYFSFIVETGGEFCQPEVMLVETPDVASALQEYDASSSSSSSSSVSSPMISDVSRQRSFSPSTLSINHLGVKKTSPSMRKLGKNRRTDVRRGTKRRVSRNPEAAEAIRKVNLTDQVMSESQIEASNILKPASPLPSMEEFRLLGESHLEDSSLQNFLEKDNPFEFLENTDMELCPADDREYGQEGVTDRSMAIDVTSFDTTPIFEESSSSSRSQHHFTPREPKRSNEPLIGVARWSSVDQIDHRKGCFQSLSSRIQPATTQCQKFTFKDHSVAPKPTPGGNREFKFHSFSPTKLRNSEKENGEKKKEESTSFVWNHRDSKE